MKDVQDGGRCICDKKLGKRKDGSPAKTCQSDHWRNCAGRLSKAHMLAVLKSSPDYFAISIAPRDFKPFHADR